MNRFKIAFQDLAAPLRIYFGEKSNLLLVGVIFFLIQIFIGLEYGFEISKNFSEAGILFSYTVPFFLAVSLYAFIIKDFKFALSRKFWFISIIIIFSLFASDIFEFHLIFIKDYCPPTYRYIVYKYFLQLKVWFYYSIPMLAYFIYTKFENKFEPQNENSRIVNIPSSSYLFLVIPMVIIVILVSFLPDFQNFYPRAPKDRADIGYVSTWNQIIIFEVFYVLAFVSTEWFFRGFMIKFFSRYFGKEAILIMTVFYVMIHFEKPILETISSTFGGFVLGLYSFYTGKIRGGILVHISIAITMEVMGFYWLSKS